MRATKAVVLQRVEEVLAIRLAGGEHWDLRDHARKEGWQVSDGQLYRYIAQADELIAQSLEKDREKIVNRHLAQRRALLARTMGVSDYRTALAILKDEADLMGLYPALKQEHKVTATVEHTERREFWINLRDALQHSPEAYEAVDKVLEERIRSNAGQASNDQH